MSCFWPNHAEAQGSYKLVKAEINGEVKSLPEFRIYVGKNAVNPIAKTEGHIDLAAQATNNLGGVIKKTGSDANGDVYQLDNVSSTLVGTFGKVWCQVIRSPSLNFLKVHPANLLLSPPSLYPRTPRMKTSSLPY